MEFDFSKPELNMDNDPKIIENAKKLAAWIKSSSILPDAILDNDLILVKRFVYSTYGDLEKAKEILLLNFKIRNQNPNIFIIRDPLNIKYIETNKNLDMIPLPKYTKEKYQLHLFRLAEFDPDLYDFNESIRAYFMGTDVKLITTGISSGEVPIYDTAGSKLKHLTKVVLSTLRVYMKFQQEAQPVRLKQIHVLNCPSFMDKIMALCKPFLRSEVFKLIHFHQPGSTTLYEFVPQELLPNDYGGKAGFVADIKRDWLKKLEEHRDYLSNQKNWVTTDTNETTHSSYTSNHSMEFD